MGSWAVVRNNRVAPRVYTWREIRQLPNRLRWVTAVCPLCIIERVYLLETFPPFESHLGRHQADTDSFIPKERNNNKVKRISTHNGDSDDRMSDV